MHGLATSEIEISVISNKGFWLLLNDEELFVPYTEFPWFKNATVDALSTVEWPHPNHLYWPLLDVDLAVDSIRQPNLYPKVSKH